MRTFNIAAALCTIASTVSALSHIRIEEQEFIDPKANDRFIIVGIDYQPGGQAAYGTGMGDPLSDPSSCLRDAALMQQLGVNTIRCYNVDPTYNHDECASIFNMAGIYMLIGVNSPLAGQSIDRSDPASSYDSSYLTHIFSVVEAFKNYDNLIGFFAGNEIINDVPTGSDNPPYIRAVQRDLKNYIANHASRAIPVGYSAAQVEDVLADTWAYLQCNNSQNGVDMSRSDFFGLNSYSWCGAGSSYTTSKYNYLQSLFSASSIPVFFSEYGCNNPLPRLFDGLPTLYSPLMSALCGGLVYEWNQETNDFGLVSVTNDTLTLLPDYYTFAAKLSQTNITEIERVNATAATAEPIPACNADLISGDGFSTDFDIPAPPPGAEALIASGVPAPVPSGGMVSVTQTVVTMTVLATDGARIEGLKITAVQDANYPGSTDAAMAMTTGSGSGTTTTAAGASGASGASGTSGVSGSLSALSASGSPSASSAADASSASGAAGVSSASGTAGASGASGASSVSGASGASGVPGVPGVSDTSTSASTGATTGATMLTTAMTATTGSAPAAASTTTKKGAAGRRAEVGAAGALVAVGIGALLV